MTQLIRHAIDTPIGKMCAIADETGLHLLEFDTRKYLARNIDRLTNRLNATITIGQNAITKQIEAELSAYFAGKKTTFNTPIHSHGTEFQKQVWQALRQIPHGQTRSYLELAKMVGRPKAFRAAANANGCNQFAILIPCHRVIQTNQKLGGYAGGVAKKNWLLEHEKNKYRALL